MSYEEISLDKRNQLLEAGMRTADKFINRNYLINLYNYDIAPLDDSYKTFNTIRLIKVEKLVYDKNENINDKLISVYSALQNVNSDALLLLNGNKTKIDLYLGVRSNENSAVASKILEKGFLGNFPGSSLSSLRNKEIASIMENVVCSSGSSTKNISSVTVIPSMRDNDKDKFVQGLEKFIDTMQGSTFSALFIASPVNKIELEERKRGFEGLYSSLSPFIKTSLAYGSNYSKAVSSGMFENFSHSVNRSITNTNGGNSGTNYSKTEGKNQNINVGAGGMGGSTGTSSSSTTGYSSGSSWSNAVTEGTADTTGAGTSTTETDTTGSSKTLTVEHHNKSVSYLLEKIDEQLKRIKSCEAFGVWNCAAYFISEDIQTSVVAANTYKALMLGDNTQVENSFVNVWDVTNSNQAIRVLDYMKYCIHPIAKINPEQGYDTQYVTPGSFISGKELPLLMGLPHKSVAGLSVSSIAEFGRNVHLNGPHKPSNTIQLGNIYHMGSDDNTLVNLDIDSLTSHCFITGSTGSGKSNTSYTILEALIDNHIPFLVIEPAKGEYKEEFGDVPNVNIFSTNPTIGQMLKLNPFRFDSKIHILEHLDRLIEIFNACWEMYAAMPAILKDAVERIYTEKGWDLLNSTYMGGEEAIFPTFNDLMRVLPQIIDNSGYSADTKGDYIGALVTRVNSLTNGISGQIFCDCYDVPDKTLFDQNSIVDLSRVGSTETKSLIMGILVLRLNEYRMAHAESSNAQLKHITVLEEAHNLLKKSTPEQSGSNVAAKSVEMICNSIAEMRTYGEGFIIIDQSPTSVDISAIKNTNTKIIMRLPEKNDCEIVGKSVSLNDNQITELAKLETGIAVVTQNNWLEPVLTHINKSKSKYYLKTEYCNFDSLYDLRSKLTTSFFSQYRINKKIDYEQLDYIINKSKIPELKKKEYRLFLKNAASYINKNPDLGVFTNVLLNLTGTNNLFLAMENILEPDNPESGKKYTLDSFNKWRNYFFDTLPKFIKVPEEQVEQILIYLSRAHLEKSRSVDYYALTNMLIR